MKREFLKELGLSDDVVGKIMAEHGKAVQQKQDSIEQLNTDLTEAKNQISELTQNNTALSDKVNTLETVKTERDDLQKQLNDERVEKALIVAGGTDIDYLKFKLGKLEEGTTVEQAINQLKTDYPAFFQSKEQPKQDTSNGFEVFERPLEKGEEATSWTVAKIMALDDPKERQRLIRENPQLFKQEYEKEK